MTRRTLRLAVLFLNLTAANAHAQDALRDRPPHVFVTLERPRAEVEGELTTLTEQAVALVVDGVARQFALTEVRKVERLGDPTSDGAWRGALVLGALCFLVCGQGVDNGQQVLGAVTVNAAFGALIGWQFDRDHVGRSTLFRAPRR